MGDENNHALEAESPDSQDPAKPAQSQQAGAGGGQSAEATKATEPKYVTEDQLQEKLDKHYQATQSLVQKGQNVVAQKMQEYDASIKRLESLGQQFTPEQKTAMRSAAFDKALEEASSPTPPGDNADQDALTWDEAVKRDPFTARAYEIQKQAGLFIDPSDPEVTMIKRQGTPEEYLTSISAAVNAKKTRTTATSQDKTNQPAETEPSGQIPATPGGNHPSTYDPKLSPDHYFQQHEENKRRR